VHRPWGYHHSCVYIGGGEVVQVSAEPTQMVGALLHGRDHFPTQVQRVSLAQFARGDAPRIGPCGTAPDPQVAIQRALSMVGQPWDYNPLTHNCQHFSSWCVTGVATSPEAESIARAFGEIGRAPANVAGAVEHGVGGAAHGVGQAAGNVAHGIGAAVSHLF
jgi:hypothetical protein